MGPPTQAPAPTCPPVLVVGATYPHLCVQRYLDRCGFSSAGFLSGAWRGLATGSESGYAPDAIKTPHPIKLNSQVFIADKLSAY